MLRRSSGEGTVFFLEAKRLWVGKLYLPNGKRKVKYGRTQKEVKTWLLEQRRALSQGIVIDDQKITVDEFVQRWYDDIATHKLRGTTLDTHERIIRNHIHPTIGFLRLKDLSPAHLQNLYSDKLKSGLSKRTVRYIHTIMHQSLDQATRWGLVARNVADATETPAPDRKPVKPLTMEQIGRLLEVLKLDRLFPLYVIYIGCGLRRGEALALTLDSVDFDKSLLHIRKTLVRMKGKGLVLTEPKTDRSRRTVAMPEFVKLVLQKHLEKRDIESKFVFCTSNGTPFSPRNIVRHFKSTLKKAGLPETTRIHDLRHTFVSYLLSQNTPPRDVQEIVGHASFSTTVDIYGHLMPGAKRDAAKKMDGFFGDVGIP